MKVIVENTKDTIDVNRIGNMYVVGKDDQGNLLMILPINYDSEYHHAVILKDKNLNAYSGNDRMSKSGLVRHFTQNTPKPHEYHAFNTLKEALKWLYENA
jgi:hypothetical protein